MNKSVVESDRQMFLVNCAALVHILVKRKMR